MTIGSHSYDWFPYPWPGELVGEGNWDSRNPDSTELVYHYEFMFTHMAGVFDFALRAGGNGYQGGSDESWGIDNIRLMSSTATIPEPATWLLLVAGFGVIGLAVRRKRARRVVSS